MPEQFQLRIVTPRQEIVDAPVQEVTGPGTLGEFGVLPNHAALLTSLEIGRLSYKDSRGGVHHVAIRGGFAEVSNNLMTVLAQAALPAEEIEITQAESDLRNAEARLQQLSPLDEEYETLRAEHQWAQARLATARARPSLS